MNRFELKSWHFTDNRGVIYDNEKDEELRLSVYGLVDLLNEVSRQEYSLINLKEDINRKIDEIIDGDVE